MGRSSIFYIFLSNENRALAISSSFFPSLVIALNGPGMVFPFRHASGPILPSLKFLGQMFGRFGQGLGQ